MLTYTLYKTTTAATSVSTAATPLDLGDCLYYSIQAVFTGNDVAGTFKLQHSVDGSTWVDLAGASTSVTSSASTILTPVSQTGAPGQANYRYVRFQWTYSSGTGNLTVYAVVKQAQAYS